MALPAETERNKSLERIAIAVEHIAKNLEKLANPPVTVTKYVRPEMGTVYASLD